MSSVEKFSLTGKVAIVTGASSGLGVAFALALAEAGASVTVGGRRLDRLLDTKEQIEQRGRRSLAVPMDVTIPEDCNAIVDETFRHFGRLDILVNNAGLGSAVPASRESPKQFRQIIDVNLMGSYWMAQASSKVMSAGASIINISSVLAFRSVQLPQAAYTSSKSAVIGLTRDLAQQWSGRKGIRVNAVAPGYFLTEMTEELDQGYLTKFIKDQVPMNRLGRLDECASVVVFLASDAASFITGICIPVDGGLMTS